MSGTTGTYPPSNQEMIYIGIDNPLYDQTPKKDKVASKILQMAKKIKFDLYKLECLEAHRKNAFFLVCASIERKGREKEKIEKARIEAEKELKRKEEKEKHAGNEIMRISYANANSKEIKPIEVIPRSAPMIVVEQGEGNIYPEQNSHIIFNVGEDINPSVSSMATSIISDLGRFIYSRVFMVIPISGVTCAFWHVGRSIYHMTAETLLS